MLQVGDEVLYPAPVDKALVTCRDPLVVEGVAVGRAGYLRIVAHRQGSVEELGPPLVGEGGYALPDRFRVQPAGHDADDAGDGAGRQDHRDPAAAELSRGQGRLDLADDRRPEIAAGRGSEKGGALPGVDPGAVVEDQRRADGHRVAAAAVGLVQAAGVDDAHGPR